MTKRAVFIGRYSPFHNGHLSIMKKKIDEGKPILVLIRDTYYDLYPAKLRKRMIEAAMARLKADAKIEIIDDIESINYGRGVGYEVNEIQVPDNIKEISATDIRNRIQRGDHSWKGYIPDGADEVLERYMANAGVVVWFTGLPKSGKKTIANLVYEDLEKKGIKAEKIDSRFLREIISKDLSYSKEDRNRNIERAKNLAKLLSRNGATVLCSFITPYESMRKELRKDLGEKASFVEVYIKSSLYTCKLRDTDDLYKKAERGELEHFTGVSDPFEEPQNPHLILDTEKKSAEECAREILEYIESLR